MAFSKGSFVLSARTGLNVRDRYIGREARPSITGRKGATITSCEANTDHKWNVKAECGLVGMYKGICGLKKMLAKHKIKTNQGADIAQAANPLVSGVRTRAQGAASNQALPISPLLTTEGPMEPLHFTFHYQVPPTPMSEKISNCLPK
ncbi:hypothetical protein HAX54_006578 [Datura stramonium]|uniref:Uncharacterized protein n=1 Tax=Datura stramonium TaxID=4076 RepID=A0ABS8TAI2_DATST|nr:hypothetical protein [Datura stramonium]